MTIDHRPRRGPGYPQFLLTLAVLTVLVVVPEAVAGPIRTANTARPLAEVRRPTAQAQARARAQALALEVNRRGSFWDGYFARALAQRSLRVQGPNAVRVLSASPDGRLPDSAFVDYLLWRRSLNPARFDRYHPHLVPLLTQRPVTPRVFPELPVEPGTVLPPPINPPLPPISPEIPEPGTAMIALTILGAVRLAHLWRRRRSTGLVVSSTA